MKLTMKQLLSTFNLLWMVLLANFAVAEQQNGCLKLTDLRSDFDSVATGTSMNLQLKFRTHDCHLVVSLSPSALSLKSESQSGLDLSIYYGGFDKINKSKNAWNGQTADELNMTVVVSPRSEVTPGKYQVPAVLNYQVMDDKGNVMQQSASLEIPVKVVASVTEVHSKPDHWKPLKITGEVAAGVVLVPVVLVLGFVQLLTGIQILPDC